MAHSDLKYDDIHVGIKGVCLNLNLLGSCLDASCQYQHSKSNPRPDRVKAVSKKLRLPAVEKYLSDGGLMGKHKQGP
jgi:hypothetical protein